MSHRLDSDVPWPFFKVVDLEIEEVVAPSRHVNWRKVDENFYDHKLMEITKRKTKDLVWVSSNFLPLSKRNLLIKELKKQNISVDIYGKMGDHGYVLVSPVTKFSKFCSF